VGSAIVSEDEMAQPLKVLLACSGLDHARRGFETFARECFDALRDVPELEIELVKGTGPEREHERSVPSLTRDSLVARSLGRVSGREPFRFEQMAFAFSLQPAIRQSDPDIVYFSEWHTGLVLERLRRWSNGRYRLLLCNGTMAVEGFGHLDLVQQLTPVALRLVEERGADPSRQRLLPLGVRMPQSHAEMSPDERGSLRRQLGLPDDRPILLSVAALNRYHKRIDYLIEEVARLPSPRPLLLLAGQVEAETEGLRSLATTHLGSDGYVMRTVPHEEIGALYRAADAFVLTSLGESFGLVLVEAAAHGLPCFAHDFEITRFVLGQHGYLGDLSVPGGLAGLLSRQQLWARNPVRAEERHRFAYEHFSWERLRPAYLDLLREAANRTVASSSGLKLAR
jgi:glycosyltransferase involved in cell wall biosynthesis